MAYAQFVDEAGDVGYGKVVVGLTVVGADIVGVLRRGRVALERGAGVVECVRPTEGVEQGQAGDKTLFVANLQGIVVGLEVVDGGGDVRRPVGIGPVGDTAGVVLPVLL